MMGAGLYNLVLLVVACFSLLVSVRAITFKVFPDVRKCLREEVHKDVLVVGDYQLSDTPGLRTDITVSRKRMCRVEVEARSNQCSN